MKSPLPGSNIKIYKKYSSVVFRFSFAMAKCDLENNINKNPYNQYF